MLAAAPDGPLRGVPIAIKDEWPLPWRAQRFGAAALAGAVPARRVGSLPGPARRRRGDRRGREHARAGLQQHRQRLDLRAGPQPLEHRALPRRLLQRARRRGRGPAGRRGGRRGRDRLDPLPGRLLRDHRPEADLRPLGDGGAPSGRADDDDRLRADVRRRRRLQAARLGPLRRAARRRRRGGPADRRRPGPRSPRTAPRRSALPARARSRRWHPKPAARCARSSSPASTSPGLAAVLVGTTERIGFISPQLLNGLGEELGPVNRGADQVPDAAAGGGNRASAAGAGAAARRAGPRLRARST